MNAFPYQTYHAANNMASKAHAKFIKTIRRCESLVASYKKLHELHSNDTATPAPKDIVRGAIVLSVSALDAYVTDVFAEKFVAYIKRFEPDENLIELLNDAGLNTKVALELIEMDRPYRRIRTLIQQHYNKYTTQKFEVIDRLFATYRLPKICTSAQRKSKRKTLNNSIKKLIDRRHEIAHSGDYNSHGKIRDIDEVLFGKRIQHLELFVTSMDEIICNRI